MNWRFLASVAIALGLRLVILAKLGWTYRPFRDPFHPILFGRDIVLFLLILAAVLAVVQAILGPSREE